MSQDKFVMGDWRAHTSEHTVNHVASGNHDVFAACSHSLLKYNVLSGETYTYTRVEGLTGVNISTIKYNNLINKLIIGYLDGNIDILSDDKIFNISDIANTTSLTSKIINNITFVSDTAYLACDYGISIINLTRKEILDTYYLGNSTKSIKVNDVVIVMDSIWVATNDGIYHATAKNTNLHDFSNWDKLQSIPNTNGEFSFIESIGDKLYIAYKGEGVKDDSIYIYKNGSYKDYDTASQYDVEMIDTKGAYTTLVASNSIDVYDSAFVYHTNYYGLKEWGNPYDAVVSDKWHMYVADRNNGLIQKILYGGQNEIVPNSPYRDYVNSITVDHGKVYVAGGTEKLKYNKVGMYRFSDNQWFNYNLDKYRFLDTIPNLNFIAVDPKNPNHYSASSNGYGVVEFLDTSFVNAYDERNSTLENITSFNHGYVSCTGIQYDDDGDLWVLASRSTHPLNLRKANGEWQSFDMGGLLKNHVTGTMLKTTWGDIWFVDKDYGFVIFNPEKLKNGDLENGIKRMQLIGSDNNSIAAYCTSMCIDNDKTLWFGLSSGGIGVYYSPESVFYNDYLYVSKIIVEGDGIANYLLDKEFVTCIKVDGANRKWLGTEKGGAFLISSTGTEQVFNLNTKNSPLLSNYIYDIGINQQTGEVFFGTINGLLSYFSGTTEGSITMEKLIIFPNPVAPDYTGKITISGLMYNSLVKITDVAGNIVFQTSSNGGTALWNMCDFNGIRVNTGVYLVYGASMEGNGKTTGKIFVISK